MWWCSPHEEAKAIATGLEPETTDDVATSNRLAEQLQQISIRLEYWGQTLQHQLTESPIRPCSFGVLAGPQPPSRSSTLLPPPEKGDKVADLLALLPIEVNNLSRSGEGSESASKGPADLEVNDIMLKDGDEHHFAGILKDESGSVTLPKDRDQESSLGGVGGDDRILINKDHDDHHHEHVRFMQNPRPSNWTHHSSTTTPSSVMLTSQDYRQHSMVFPDFRRSEQDSHGHGPTVQKARTLHSVRRANLRSKYAKRTESRFLQGSRNCAEALVSHRWFDYFVGVVIIFNAAMIGAQVQHQAVSGTDIAFFEWSENICISVFTIELIVRLAAWRVRFFTKAGCVWGSMDIFLVVIGVVDFVWSTARGNGSSANGGSAEMNAGKILKVIRMVRIIRVIRICRFLAELRLMLQMIISSMQSLLWHLVFLVVLLYVFSVVLTQGVTDYLRTESNDDSVVTSQLRAFYGDVVETMYSLFKSMTGGVNWGEVAGPLLYVGWVHFVLFLLFISFAIFSVLNIVTGVFVDGAIEMARQDRAILIEKETQARDVAAGHLMDLLKSIDKDHDGTISRQEFQDSLDRQDVVCFMEALKIDTTEAMFIFDMLDVDGDDEVDVGEWVDGMRRLKGEAKSADLHQLRTEVRFMFAKIAEHLPVKSEEDRQSLRRSIRPNGRLSMRA